MNRPVPRSSLLPSCAIGAMVGAIAGVLTRIRHRDLWFTGIGIGLAAALLATVLAAVIALLVADTRPRTPRRKADRPADTAWKSAPPAPVPPPVPTAPAFRPAEPIGPPDPPARLVLPVEPAPAASTWWSSTTAGRRQPTAPTRPTAPDLSTYRGHARTVQCPRCGAFRIDVEQSDGGYAFRCRVDDHSWIWRAGTAWPATVVAGRRRPER